jgi:hypothetical protein
MTPEQHSTILNALTEFDRKARTKPGHNPYAFAHYCRALQRIQLYNNSGHPLRESIITCLVGRLCDAVLKALKLEQMTKEEAKFGLFPKLPYLDLDE